jgi:hypothetical protein
MADQQPSQAFDQWGIVEVMGHKKYAGHITEQVIAGSALVRVDVPEVKLAGEPPRVLNSYTKLVGVGSVYCITPTTEDVARQCAAQLARYDSDPLPVYIPEARQLAAVASQTEEIGEDGDELEFEELP